MTKHEKKIIYKASEMIATGGHEFTCCALEYCGASFDLRYKYENFCQPTPRTLLWFDDVVGFERQKKARIMALCFFAELGDEV